MRTQREVPRCARRGQRRADAREIRMRHAAALALAAVVAGQAAVVRLGEDRAAPDGHDAPPAERPAGFRARVALDDGHRHAGQELAIGQLAQAFFVAADADETLDVRIPGRDVLVANRPVVAMAVLRIRAEVEIAPPVDLPPPGDRATAELSST